MKLVPLHGNVIVRRAQAESRTPSGLVIPASHAKEKAEGTVVAVGHGRVLDNGKIAEPQVRVEDQVVFREGAALEVEVDGQKLLALDERAIIAKRPTA